MGKGAKAAWLKRLFKLGLIKRQTTVCECGDTCPSEAIRTDHEIPSLKYCTCPTCGAKWGLKH